MEIGSWPLIHHHCLDFADISAENSFCFVLWFCFVFYKSQYLWTELGCACIYSHCPSPRDTKEGKLIRNKERDFRENDFRTDEPRYWNRRRSISIAIRSVIEDRWRQMRRQRLLSAATWHRSSISCANSLMTLRWKLFWSSSLICYFTTRRSKYIQWIFWKETWWKRDNLFNVRLCFLSFHVSYLAITQTQILQ